jgi:phage recombination protein Bet
MAAPGGLRRFLKHQLENELNAVVELKPQSGALAPMSETELVTVLQSSLYPGAKLESIKMVLGYCKAAGLDPMQKPVHIVPMWDGKAKEMRDVIMPGVGLYRTQASRTDRFAGQSEPEFGPMVTQRLGGVEFTFPEWARVTVKKLMTNGSVAEFTACEYWLENYAVKGGQEKSLAPNAMWTKRPRGQIAKCAAAQALRLAFPEMGAQPTAEEMEGKQLDEDENAPAHVGKPAVTMPQPRAKAPPAQQDDAGGVTDVTPKGEAHPAVDSTLATVGEIAYILKKITAKGVTIEAAREMAQLDPGEKLDGITKDQFVALKDALV